MIRIGVSQRVTSVAEYEEYRDCLDQRWGPLLRSFGFLPIPLFNRITDVETYLKDLELGGVVLTGGNDLDILDDGSNVAPERDAFERTLLDFALDRDLPVLGVCRGAQFINTYFGGSLSPVDNHVATPHDVSVPKAPFEETATTVTTNSYHNYGIKPRDLAAELQAVGYTADDSIEWIEHETYPVSAIMWHPERESPSAAFDRRLINYGFESSEQ